MTASGRADLNAAGWSWLDRRGHLRLRAPGVFVDTDVPALSGVAAGPRAPLAGRAGRTVAYQLLLDACEGSARPLSPTKDAPLLHLAPSSVSVALADLRDAGLADRDGNATVPELFWELASAWTVEWTWLAVAPPAPAELDVPGWRRGGTAAAVALGAPAVTAGEHAVHLYVPSKVEATLEARRRGVVPGPSEAAIAVAPVPQICDSPAAGIDSDGWPLAHPVAIALDLAQDVARGREILSDWEPAGRARVW